jgi:hypothetical protein
MHGDGHGHSASESQVRIHGLMLKSGVRCDNEGNGFGGNIHADVDRTDAQPRSLEYEL